MDPSSNSQNPLSQENIVTNFKIVPRPLTTDKIGNDVNNQYMRLVIIFILSFIVIVLALKEFLAGLQFIREYSITDVLIRDSYE